MRLLDKKYVLEVIGVCLAMISVSCREVLPPTPPPVIHVPNILIEDFESQTYRTWTATGDAFGRYPYLVPTNVLKEWGNEGFEGNFMISSYVNGDKGTGTLISPTFRIERKYLNFLISGGFEDVYVTLLVDGKEVFREMGLKNRKMSWVSKDLSAYKGKLAQIKIVDNSVTGWGFIDADYFCLSDNPIGVNKKKSIKIEKKYLNIPVGYHVDMEKVNIFSSGKLLYEFDVRISSQPDYWVYLDCERWKGETIDLEVNCNPLHSMPEVAAAAIDLISQSDEPLEKSLFYMEPYRPYYHYTVARAWLTDVCGIFYLNGKWHLQYQRNPFGIDWGNMHWGHAISDDLLHWQELDNSIVPDTLGPVFAGMSVIDKDNTLGIHVGDEPTVVSVYTAAGGFSNMSKGKKHTQCITYSTDGGYTWMKYEKNPVLSEICAENRDPHAFWDEENGQWIMVLFLKGNSYGFFKSDNLVQWEMMSTFSLAGEFECPDFYEINVEESDEKKWVLSGVHGYYQVGTWNGTHFIAETAVKDLDFGPMTFVPRTFGNVPDGRKIQIWNTGEQFGYIPFRNQMTFPRELKLRKKGNDYILCSSPIQEIERLHSKEYAFSTLPVSQQVATSAYHLKVRFVVEKSVGLLEMNMNGMTFRYNISSHKFSVLNGNNVVQELEVIPENNLIDVELLSDIGFMEIFLNGGEIVGTLFQPVNTGAVQVSAKVSNEACRIDYFNIYEMKNIWK